MTREPATDREPRASPANSEVLAALEFCATAPLDRVQRTLKLAAAMVYGHGGGEDRKRDSNAPAGTQPATGAKRR